MALIGLAGTTTSGRQQQPAIDPLISSMFHATTTTTTTTTAAAGRPAGKPADIRNNCTYKVLKRILIRSILALRDWGVVISAEFNSTAAARVVLDLSIAALAKDLQLVTAISSPTVSAQLAIADSVTVAKMTESFLAAIKAQLGNK